MIIYPAIDLKDQKCVRLYQGSFDAVTTYESDPLTVAEHYASQGAQYLHVVDLDGAKKGEPVHTEMVLNMIKATGLKVQMGGGIRTKAYAQKLLDQGLHRIIIGSMAIKEPQTVKAWFNEFGSEHITMALDLRMNTQQEPELATHGWLERSGVTLWQLLDTYSDVALRHVLCTDIACDGTLKGSNLNLYEQCQQRFPHLQFQASGGVGSLKDIQALKQMNLAGAIVGKALYEQKFSLTEALAL